MGGGNVTITQEANLLTQHEPARMYSRVTKYIWCKESVNTMVVVKAIYGKMVSRWQTLTSLPSQPSWKWKDLTAVWVWLMQKLFQCIYKARRDGGEVKTTMVYERSNCWEKNYWKEGLRNGFYLSEKGNKWNLMRFLGEFDLGRYDRCVCCLGAFTG